MRRRAGPVGADWRGRLAEAGVGGALADRLGAFLDLLVRFGSAVDLVARVRPEVLLRDHVMESLVASPLLPPAGTVLDLGSGGGFPIVPLLLARPELRGVLLEPRERRWAFLGEVVRALELQAEVRRARVADVQGRFEALTVRALGAEAWVNDAGRLLAAGGRTLWWTRERTAPPAGFERVVTSPLPNSGRGRVVVWRRCST